MIQVLLPQPGPQGGCVTTSKPNADAHDALEGRATKPERQTATLNNTCPAWLDNSRAAMEAKSEASKLQPVYSLLTTATAEDVGKDDGPLTFAACFKAVLALVNRVCRVDVKLGNKLFERLMACVLFTFT